MFTVRQFELIGRMTIAFNNLEAIIVDYAPTFVLGPISVGRSLATLAKAYLDKQRTFSQKLECLKTILKGLPDDDKEITRHIEVILKSLPRAKHFARRRNEIVHSEIAFDAANHRFVLQNREGMIESGEKALSMLVDELSDFVDVFCVSCNDLYAVLSDKRGYHFPN
jgi:hypothetical protein